MSSFNSFLKTVPTARSMQLRRELPGAKKKKGDQGIRGIDVGEGRTKRKQKCEVGTREKKRDSWKSFQKSNTYGKGKRKKKEK